MRKFGKKMGLFLIWLLIISSSELFMLPNYFNRSSFLLPQALAAEPIYSAKLISVSPGSPIRLEPGKALTIELKYKNTGNVVWEKNILNFTCLGTAEPLMRASQFRHKFWEEAYRPTRLLENKVKPGEIGTFRFAIQAPKKSGTYNEAFQLVIRRVAWLEGSLVNIPLLVGDQTFSGNNSNQPDTASLATDKAFHTPTAEQVANLKKEMDEINKQKHQFELAASEAQLESNDAVNTVAPENIIAGQFGPMIRVGLYSTNNPIEVTATRRYEIKAGDGSLIAQMNAGERTTLSYEPASNSYRIQTSSLNVTRTDFPYLSSQESSVVFKIENYNNRLPWNPEVNDNRFRTKIELRHSEATGKTWVINELAMEHYVKGVSEVSNLSPQEYLKAMSVAIRTYAYYHYNKGVMNLIRDGSTKHANEHFHVDSLYDQVYRGYGIEERLTNFNQAIDETRGQIVKYDNKVAITPYFSRSDGRTRSFREVWNNDVPWLISVPTPYDQSGLAGHGVGLAATDAYRRADRGETYQNILKYYYTGVTIQPQY